ncbi:shikimate dehydrogenase family protein [Zobellella iuensis]|uniref:Shikimate dehydrogenase substrate binding N-terminal domain-containing protein n=1 Tax=Zobellella iuensis TaxID=2803811 RepID=A0ABS1QLY8_9GAMM|nr:hypothetical protein [Zobellella iuensis]MBL1375880.1 hypothetical protein [Zobellella iuensis]
MIEKLDGSTRLYLIIGDPIAQVKSPLGVTRQLQDKGLNALVAPLHVTPDDLPAFMAGAGLARNIDGIIVTVPHKFSAYRFCADATPRARFLNAVNIMRRRADGSWYGDMVDGVGYVGALRDKGCAVGGRHGLVVGAGGAGSAIAHSLLEAGVASLAIHDEDRARRDALIARLAGLDLAEVKAGSPRPAGYDLVINATPTGMKAEDPYPIEVEELRASTFVGDVITAPVVSPLVELARARGCGTMLGVDMFAAVCERMVDFLLAGEKERQTG